MQLTNKYSYKLYKQKDALSNEPDIRLAFRINRPVDRVTKRRCSCFRPYAHGRFGSARHLERFVQTHIKEEHPWNSINLPVAIF